jgi:peptidoglycan/xylan/chitin deacetylase (PgdA/CDA1 family)
VAVLGLDLLKRAAFEMAQRSGFNALARQLLRRRLVVLCYHSVISDDAPLDPRTNIAVTTSQFELHLRELAASFTPVSAGQVIAAGYYDLPLPPRAVLVTFDDGYRNNLELAAPLLLKYEIPAIFFVTTGLIGTRELLWTHEIVERVAAWPKTRLTSKCLGIAELPQDDFRRVEVGRSIVDACKRMSNKHRMELLTAIRTFDFEISDHWKRELYDFMTWDEVRQLKQLGFEIGAHTIDHPILTSLCDSEMSRQLAESKQTLEREVKEKCLSVAYPNGSVLDFSDTVIRAATDAGFRLGFTLCERGNLAAYNPLAIDRVCVTRDISFRRFQLRLTSAH